MRHHFYCDKAEMKFEHFHEARPFLKIELNSASRVGIDILIQLLGDAKAPRMLYAITSCANN